jgi:hypothetical protein
MARPAISLKRISPCRNGHFSHIIYPSSMNKRENEKSTAHPVLFVINRLFTCSVIEHQHTDCATTNRNTNDLTNGYPGTDGHSGSNR